MNDVDRIFRRRAILRAGAAGLMIARGGPVARAAAWLGRVAEDEPKLWEAQRLAAEAAFDFWKGFLEFRMGAASDMKLDADCRDRFLCIIRAVSWVESKHGTFDGGTAGIRDPMQCGHPSDTWWKELTGQATTQDRFVGGPGAKNYDAD
jgi:hypothetical protein